VRAISASRGAIEIVNGKARRQSKGFINYTLRVRVNMATQPVAMALIEAESEDKPPAHGLEQAKKYAEKTKRLNVQFVFSSNGHLFAEYGRHKKVTSAARPMSEFPTPDALRQPYEERMGFRLDDTAAKPLRTLRRDRLYERLEITGTRGLTEAQKATLHALGAVEAKGISKRAST
jgi:type I restriction enzyme, R subunit